jgi:hypothetical protein
MVAPVIVCAAVFAVAVTIAVGAKVASAATALRLIYRHQFESTLDVFGQFPELALIPHGRKQQVSGHRLAMSPDRHPNLEENTPNLKEILVLAALQAAYRSRRIFFAIPSSAPPSSVKCAVELLAELLQGIRYSINRFIVPHCFFLHF